MPGQLTKVVVGYKWTDDEGMVPIWGPPALAPTVPAKPKPRKNTHGGITTQPKPDKVITKWQMGQGSIFRIRATLPKPDERVVVVYSNGFDQCMSELAAEAKSALPYRIECSYDGSNYTLWRKQAPANDSAQAYSVCCKDLTNRLRAKVEAERKADQWKVACDDAS